MPATRLAPPRPLHRAARVEDAVRGVLNRILVRRGWRPRVLAYTGYGTQDWVRVLARVVLAPPGTRRHHLTARRGWRRFFTAPCSAGVPVTIDVGGRRHEVHSARGGYVDVVLPASLPAGTAKAEVGIAGGSACEALLSIVGPGTRTGIVSDIDDTVMITALPRPLLAFWNTFMRVETARTPVPGMAELYRRLLAQDPNTPVIYLSTGPWNIAPALDAFLERNGFPPGPLLLTDWGPTPDAWFRSGQEHKRTQLRRLMRELPDLGWILVGDDGQHDPALYAEVVAAFPGRVRTVAIRQLSALEQVLTHGTTEPLPDAPSTATAAAAEVHEVRAPDGDGLVAALRERGVLPRA